MTRSERNYGLLLIAMVAIVLRFYYLHQGLPDLLYVDGYKFVSAAREMVETGELHPRRFQYPGLLTYLLAASYKITGADTDYFCYLTARLFSALAGIALVLLTYTAARQLTARPGALIAAGLAACSLVLVTYSRLPVSDIILACFMLACIVTLLSDRAGTRNLLLAGAFAGLAVGTKFSGLFMLPFGVLVILLKAGVRDKKLPLVRGTLNFSISAALVFILTTPWIIVSFSEYWTRFSEEMYGQGFGQIGRIQLGYFDYLVSKTPTWEQPWLGTSIAANEGLAVLLAGAVAALAALSFRFGYKAAVHALLILVYLAIVSQPGHLKAIRFVAPVLPSLFILCGWLCGLLLEGRRDRVRKAGYAALGLVLLAYPAYRSASFAAINSEVSTVTHARAWIYSNVPRQARLVLSPYFINTLYGVTDHTEYIKNTHRQYRLPDNIDANSELEPIFSTGLLEKFRAGGVEYYVANSWFEGAYTGVRENLRWFPNSVRSYAEFQAALQRHATVVYEIRGFEGGRPGPDIQIYRLAPNLTTDH